MWRKRLSSYPKVLVVAPKLLGFLKFFIEPVIQQLAQNLNGLHSLIFKTSNHGN